MKQRLGSFLKNVALVGVSLLVALLVAEGAIRLLNLEPVQATAIDEHGLRRGQPHARFTNNSENVNEVVYNNWGFHDRDRTPPSEAYRLLVLGDSFVEALQVPTDSIFTMHLERLLSAQNGPTEVINAGMSGTGTAVQYLLWQTTFDGQIDVDHVVVLMYLGNDLEDNHPVLRQRVLENSPDNWRPYLNANGDIVRPLSQKTPSPSMVDRLSEHSALVHMLRRRIFLLKRQMRQQAEAVPSPDSASAVIPLALDTAWAETETATLHLLERWSEELAARGTAFSVVILPSPFFYRDGQYKAGHAHKLRFLQRLDTLATRHPLSVYDVSFDADAPEAIFSFDGKTLGHFNYDGHRRAAQQLADSLKMNVNL